MHTNEKDDKTVSYLTLYYIKDPNLSHTLVNSTWNVNETKLDQLMESVLIYCKYI